MAQAACLRLSAPLMAGLDRPLGLRSTTAVKFVRFINQGREGCGVVDGEAVREMSGSIFSQHTISDNIFPFEGLRILPPCSPSKIIALGLNYRSHAEELQMKIPQEPLIFMKPASAVIGQGDTILCPAMAQRVDYEAELGVVIGRTCRNVSQEDAAHHILGYTCVNDVTARDLQRKDVQFTRSKSFDTFAPLGPCIETALDPDNVRVESLLNGAVRQSASTQDLIFPVSYLVMFISHIMTLHPGDVIATGTPSGIGPMQPGDTIEVRIEGIGTLRNRVA
jgi:2-keto-4-pentenoate hydratase/2-oxohepta-3-ene-1,7-dioic acid hydratase in catechol pathway